MKVILAGKRSKYEKSVEAKMNEAGNTFRCEVCEEQENLKLDCEQASQPICSLADIEKTGDTLALKQYLEQSFA